MEKMNLVSEKNMTALKSLLCSCRAFAIVAAVLLLAAGTPPLLAAEEGGSTAAVSNVHYAVNGFRVKVWFDLAGKKDAKYNVGILLRNRNDPAFRYAPKALTGNVGTGAFAGRNNLIVWDMSKEFPQGLQGSGYYFVVNAQRVSSGHSTSILTWIGAGAVAVAAVVTYVVVSHNGGPTSPASYPNPPGRP